MTAFNDTFGIIGLSSENVGIDRRIYTGLTSTNPQLNVSYNGGRVDVYLNGVKLMGNHSGQSNYDYTYQNTGSGSAITLSTGVALVATDTIECVGYVSNSSNTVTSYNPTPANTDGGWNVFANISHSASDLVNVFLNGVLLDDSDYTLDSSTNTVTIGGATLTASDVVVIQVIGALDHSDFVSATDGGTFSGDVAVNGDLTVDTDTLKVDSTGNKVGIGTNAADKLQVKGAISSEATNSTNRWMVYTHTDNTYRVNYNGAGNDELKLDTSGNLTIDSGNLVIGTAGQGIDFSAQTAPVVTVANTSEVLDHYEEGSFEPLFADASGNTQALSANYKRLRYVRIGSLVHISGYTGVESTGFGGLTGADAVRLQGLPFTAAGNISGSGTGYYRIPVHIGLIYGMQFGSGPFMVEGDVQYGSTHINLRVNDVTDTNSSQSTDLTVNELSNNGFFSLSFTYVCQ